MNKTTWGNTCWGAFHCAAAHIPDHPYAVASLLHHIRVISRVLPCPHCREHASYILSGQRRAITTKHDVERAIWSYHNIVNRALRKPFFPWSEYIKLYGRSRLGPHMERFIHVMTKPMHGTRDFAYALARQRACRAFYTWVRMNRYAFAVTPYGN